MAEENQVMKEPQGEAAQAQPSSFNHHHLLLIRITRL